MKNPENHREEIRIGVYVCYCGSNIAGFVDVEDVSNYAATLSDVVVTRTNHYTCSDAGQAEIKEDIQRLRLNRVVVASCTPRTHEPIFRACVAEASLNPYLFTLANIREHCSWIHMYEPKKATAKAKDIIRMYVAKARNLQPQPAREVPVERRVLVIGGGVAGMTAALDLADMGVEVILVEKYPSIGGVMAQLDKVYPTNDCSICILGPKMVQVGSHPNIKLLSFSEVVKVQGYVGNFDVTIQRKARKVDEKLCTACGICASKCPIEVPHEWDQGLKTRNAIYLPFPQAVPAKYVIDEENCIQCGRCAKACPRQAINLDMDDHFEEYKIGAIIVATGFTSYVPEKGNLWGYGVLDNVLTTPELERITNASGPTNGKLVRPGDLHTPTDITFITCVGSQDMTRGAPFCSSYCCMAIMKLAQLIKEKYPININILYMDIRAPFRGYEEYYSRSREQYSFRFYRGQPSSIEELSNGNLVVTFEDTLRSEILELETDMVVLAVGVRPNNASETLQNLLTVPLAPDGFFMEAHPQLQPNDTVIDGIFLAGMAQGPKDIQLSVMQGSASASRAARLINAGHVRIEPITAFVIKDHCMGCGDCIDVCPYKAISLVDNKAEIVEAVCKGCGCCVAVCNSGAIEQRHYTNRDISSQIKAALEAHVTIS